MFPIMANYIFYDLFNFIYLGIYKIKLKIFFHHKVIKFVIIYIFTHLYTFCMCITFLFLCRFSLFSFKGDIVS